MAGSDRPRFTLIGGGLAGGLLATYLGRAGYDVSLYERRADPGAGNFVGGRSINLAMSTRGIHALELVGLATPVMEHAIQMRGRMIHDKRGGHHLQPYDKDPTNCINSIGRAALNSVTLAAAQQLPGVRVYFNSRCADVDLEKPSAHIVNTETNEDLHTDGDIVIGVDGAFSTVRRSMQRLDRFDYRQDYLRHGYKELTIPPASGGGFRMEKNVLHIWPRRSFMMIALPNPDGSFTCTLFWQFDGASSFSAIRSNDDVRTFFETEFPDAVPLMPTLLDDFHENPTGSMVTVRCRPWHVRDKVVLLGDAAHAVVPFYGQGMNAAFEDVVVLDECIKRFAPDWSRVFEQYEAQRKPNVDALADLAIDNFIEMRDKTASRAFHMRKKLERSLHRRLPGFFTPLYSMVSFSRIPYADALRRARRQDRTVLIVGSIVLMLLLTVVFRIWLGDRWVACASLAAVLVSGIVQWIGTRMNRRAES